MPREQVHWEIFESVHRRLESEEHPLLAPALRECRAVGYLGAMAPDSPFYYRFGGTSFTLVSERVHGTSGEDTLAFPRALARRGLALPPGIERSTALALTVGWLSHVAVDALFHPVIFYHTGNYYDPDPEERKRARRRHNAFEVFLDSWWEARIPTPLAYTRMQPILRAVGGRLDAICETLSGVPLPGAPPMDQAGVENPREASPGEPNPGDGNPSVAVQWRRALRYLARLQSVFRSPVSGAAIHALSRLSPKYMGPMDSLVSFRRTEPQHFFDEPVEYRNPVSGEEHRRSVSELREVAVQRTLEWARELESGFLDEVGPTMDAGIPRTRTEQMRHFHPGTPAFVDRSLGYPVHEDSPAPTMAGQASS